MTDHAYNALEVSGATGLRRYGGKVDEEWHPKLRNAKAVDVYREMSDNDALIGAFVYAIESLIKQTEWKIDAAGKDNEQLALAEFVDGCLDDMSHTWSDFISEILTEIVYGWSLFEQCYKIRAGDHELPGFRSKHADGRYGWRKFSIRSQESLDRWQFDSDGGIQGMYQRPAPDYRERFIPIERAILFRTKSHKNNPEGRSMLRNAYRSWYFLKHLQELESQGAERDLIGLPVIYLPPEVMASNASTALKSVRAAYETAGQKLQRGEYDCLVFPSKLDREGNPTGYEIELLGGGGTRQFNLNEVIRRYESRIALSVLGEFLMLGIDQHGSFSLADTKTGLFATALGALMDSIADTFNRFAISRLMVRNGWTDSRLWPSLVHGDIEKPNLAELASYLTAVSGYIVPDDELENHLRGAAGLPQPDPTTARSAPEQLTLPEFGLSNTGLSGVA